MASSRPSHPGGRPQRWRCGRTSPAQAPAPCGCPLPCLHSPPLAAAPAARGSAALRARARHGPSAPPPARVARAATAGRRPGPGWLPAAAAAAWGQPPWSDGWDKARGGRPPAAPWPRVGPRRPRRPRRPAGAGEPRHTARGERPAQGGQPGMERRPRAAAPPRAPPPAALLAQGCDARRREPRGHGQPPRLGPRAWGRTARRLSPGATRGPQRRQGGLASLPHKQRPAVRRHHRPPRRPHPLGPRQGARPARAPAHERALRRARRPPPRAGALQALAGFVCAARALGAVTPPSRPRVAWARAPGPSAATRGGQGRARRGGFHPPPRPGVRGHGAHPGGGPPAAALGPARPWTRPSPGPRWPANRGPGGAGQAPGQAGHGHGRQEPPLGGPGARRGPHPSPPR